MLCRGHPDRSASLLPPFTPRPAKPLACSMQGTRGLAQAAEKEVKLPPQHGVPGRYAAALYMASVKTGTLGKVEEELSQVWGPGLSPSEGGNLQQDSMRERRRAAGEDAGLPACSRRHQWQATQQSC